MYQVGQAVINDMGKLISVHEVALAGFARVGNLLDNNATFNIKLDEIRPATEAEILAEAILMARLLNATKYN